MRISWKHCRMTNLTTHFSQGFPACLVLAFCMCGSYPLQVANKIEFKLFTNRGKYSFKLNDFRKKALTALANKIK